jgi:hypothetical protein
MNNKVLGSNTMRAGSRIEAHARDNDGGRKGLRAAETAMNQLLTANSILARRGRAVIMSNDAKGSYDRITHMVVNLALRRLGIPSPALQSMISDNHNSRDGTSREHSIWGIQRMVRRRPIKTTPSKHSLS